MTAAQGDLGAGLKLYGVFSMEKRFQLAHPGDLHDGRAADPNKLLRGKPLGNRSHGLAHQVVL